jgi:hypothetical protein
MALTNAYVLPVNRIPELFRKIQEGQAPERFTNQLLKDWGFKSTNDRAFIPLLKALGFSQRTESRPSDISNIESTHALNRFLDRPSETHTEKFS